MYLKYKILTKEGEERTYLTDIGEKPFWEAVQYIVTTRVFEFETLLEITENE